MFDMVLSEPQIKAIEQIIKIDEFEPGRWFTQMELYRVTLHTIRALIEKGYVIEKDLDELSLRYYQYTGKELE